MTDQATTEFSHGGVKGSAEYSAEDNIWHGKILDISDLVTYEAKNEEDLREEFCIAVEDWHQTRVDIGT